jgi:hypothetical protein
MTRAPRAAAICTTIKPTPPEAPCTSTVSPAPALVTVSRWTAVTPATINPPAPAQSRSAGFGTADDAGTISSAA